MKPHPDISATSPEVQRLQGSCVVIKYGGNAMTSPALKEQFAENIIELQRLGLKPIVVHGGGPQIGQLLEKLDIESRFIQGMRVTDPATMSVVEMVLGGSVNQDIVSLIVSKGGKAVGLTGKDAGLIEAMPLAMTIEDDNGQVQPVDLGQVGEVTNIDTTLLDTLMQADLIPIIAPIGSDKNGLAYNINADLVAGAVAKAMQSEKLLLLTNTPGILDKNDQVLPHLDADAVAALIEDGTIYGGMLPKIQCALESVQGGVQSAHIVDGRIENAVLLELFTETGSGTAIHHRKNIHQSNTSE